MHPTVENVGSCLSAVYQIAVWVSLLQGGDGKAQSNMSRKNELGLVLLIILILSTLIQTPGQEHT